jgi:hydrogenase nickel incorporation protein HypB
MTLQETAVEPAEQQLARSNRKLLREAGLCAVNLIGGAGCGKTALLQATGRALAGRRRVGVITAGPVSRGDRERIARLREPTVSVDPGAIGHLTARHVHSALARLDLANLDLMLIENVSSLPGPADVDLGEDAKVAVFSVAAGAHVPAKYPDLVRSSRAVVLNKVDLLAIAPFDLAAFRETVRGLNPSAALIETSVATGAGFAVWLDWLLNRAAIKSPAGSALRT